MSSRDLIELALQKPDSPQFHKALLASVPEAGLKAGTASLSGRGQALFAVESSGTPRLFIDEAPSSAMNEISGSHLWFAVVPLKTGRGHSFYYMTDGKKFGGNANVPSFGSDSYLKPGVPQGKLSEKAVFTSKIYDGMQSDYWVYAPAQYDPNTPAALMVWDDGGQFIHRDSTSIRLLEVIDNLTYEKRLPVIVWVFTMPGVATMAEGTPFYKAVQKAAKANTQAARTNALRGVEYETLSDQYARFLGDELLPYVQSKYNIRKDAYSHAIAGLSSGALGAFTAAWEHPDQFSRVLVWVTPFTSGQWQPSVRDGGNIYPFKIRKEPKKNLRIWLQDGCDDLENANGSVPLQNIEVANSLKLQGYDFHLSFGVGGHSPMQGSAEFPESLAWLWRGYDPAKTQETYTMDDTEKLQPVFRVHIFNRE
ncbi:MAG: alpha/beta hydrolase-fold protein [Bryobacteraceae bacterium]